jgi:hypothetical protein
LSRPDLATGPQFASLPAKWEPPVGGLSQPRRDTADPEIFSTPCDGAITNRQIYPTRNSKSIFFYKKIYPAQKSTPKITKNQEKTAPLPSLFIDCRPAATHRGELPDLVIPAKPVLSRACPERSEFTLSVIEGNGPKEQESRPSQLV